MRKDFIEINDKTDAEILGTKMYEIVRNQLSFINSAKEIEIVINAINAMIRKKIGHIEDYGKGYRRMNYHTFYNLNRATLLSIVSDTILDAYFQYGKDVDVLKLRKTIFHSIQNVKLLDMDMIKKAEENLKVIKDIDI